MSSPLADAIRAHLNDRPDRHVVVPLETALRAVVDKCEEVRGGLFTDGIDLASDIESAIARPLGIEEN